ncbi:peptidylprolyl isomerase [Psychroserpens mesophilus]|uniref:peptidylprolyl isomerase n=1 Tax=Psychroserpens mesophilus TaxID=325473 RepID=UPI003D658339
MKTRLKTGLVLVLGLLFLSYNLKSDDRKIVEMTTNYGTMVIELYNETPLHRDNFIKLIHDKAYDSLLFHRVIETFMIQGGDPDSRYAKPDKMLGEGDLEYKVDAEFKPNLFHQKGALSTAREETLGRVSSAMQFFIVQGKVFNDSLLDVAESRINKMLARHHLLNQPENASLWKALKKAEENVEQYTIMNDSINALAESFTDFIRYEIPQSHREVYKTIGGTPHLDQNYTVFGQVIEGLEVVDSIAKVKTDRWDRPIEDVRILSVRLK